MVKKKRLKLEDEQAESMAEIKTKALELEASLREQEMRVEVLKRDKVLLLDELGKVKEREKSIVQLWEGRSTMTTQEKEKVMHLDNQHHTKMVALQDAKDKEISDKLKKVNERLRLLDSEKMQLEDVILTKFFSF